VTIDDKATPSERLRAEALCHLGDSDPFVNDLLAVCDERDALLRENEEQARLLGMSGEREADWLGEKERLLRAVKELREILRKTLTHVRHSKRCVETAYATENGLCSCGVDDIQPEIDRLLFSTAQYDEAQRPQRSEDNEGAGS